MKIIYKITHKETNKAYIGKTTNLTRRLKDHYRNKKSYIGRSMRLYGIDAFDVEIIFETDIDEELSIKEYELITAHNTIWPNGFNLTYKTDNNIVKADITKKLISTKIQQNSRGKTENRTSNYIGVSSNTDGRTFITGIQFENTTITKVVDSEIEAAKLYDKLALYYYGCDAKINFEYLRDSYLNESLEEVHRLFMKRRQFSSQYRFVKLNKRTNKWVANIHALKIGESLMGSLYDTEEEAAKIVDQIIIFFKIPKKLNFPMMEYSEQQINKTVNELRTKARKTSSYKGISFCEKRRGWIANGHRNRYIGFFKTEEEAIIALKTAK